MEDSYELNREIMENLEMLQWISERNADVPIADLAFLLDIPESEYLHNVDVILDFRE